MFSREQISDYYDVMTSSYLEYGGPARGWHYGLWDESTDSMEKAIERATTYLVEELKLAPGMRVLDLGCGVGGLGLLLAERHGVRVDGVTLNAKHCEIARGLAAERGLSELLEFHHADFTTMELEPESYQHVFHHESFCYVADAPAYFRKIVPALAPGGSWRVLEGVHRGSDDSEVALARHQACQVGWRMAPLMTIPDIEQAATDAGLEWRETDDVSQSIMPTAHLFVEMAAALRRGEVPPGALPTDPAELQIKMAHVGAGEAFSQGLIAGQFGYARLTAVKPG